MRYYCTCILYINLTFICIVYTKKNDIMYRINMRVMHCMILRRGALIQTGNFWYDSDIVNQCCGSRSGSRYGRIGIIFADPDLIQPKVKLIYIFFEKISKFWHLYDADEKDKNNVNYCCEYKSKKFDFPTFVKTWGMIRIRIGIKTMPIYNTVANFICSYFASIFTL